MANRKILVDNAGAGPAVWTTTLDTTGTINVGDAALGAVGSWVLQISGTFSGSLVLRKKLIGSVVADASAPTAYYENHATGVAVAAGTALTAAGLLKVPCDGCVLVLDYTAASGTMVVELVNLLG
jgi:hypothetical protein